MTIVPAIVLALSMTMPAGGGKPAGISHVPAEPRAATSRVGGTASWYDYRPGHAAAGPRLRKALGSHWRGMKVKVRSSSGRQVSVILSDWCACGSGSIIDLDSRSFARLAPLSRGVIKVEVFK